MTTDPLAVLVRRMTPEEELASMAAKLSQRMERGKKTNYPVRIGNLSVAWVKWNKKEMSGDYFAYLFGKVFHTETLAEWHTAIGLIEAPKKKRLIRKNLTAEDRKVMNREAQRRFRASHPTYYKELREKKKATKSPSHLT